ncbi:MAG: LysM domain protein [Parcubacteria group bacterium ADurb.Bin326]|nr:MAG: LysM domain protein [Parcubacteria group bacterium ADurb.Bin326]
MAQITIQKGQTLSGIAKQQGTTVDAIMKANPTIKNANLIYAGSTLNLPGSPTSPVVAPKASVPNPSPTVTPSSTVTPPVAQNSSPGTSSVPTKSTLYGTEVPSNTSLLKQYRSELGLDSTLKSMQDSQTSYLDTLKNLPKKSDIYQQERTKRGIDTMQTNLKSLDDRLATMEEAINSSEKDIRDRTVASNGLVTESQTQRLVASEKQPLIDEYRKLLNERNKLATEMGTADASAKEMAGMQYEDSTLPLTVAEKTLGFQKDQYSVLGDILSQVYGASEKDVANLIESAKYGKEQEKKDAQDVIDRALKLAQLANDTPAGTVLDVGGNKVVGLKGKTGSGSGNDGNDVEAYALELLNNPNFSISNVPQSIRGQVITKRDQIKAEAESATANSTPAIIDNTPPITAQQFGAGLQDVFTKQIPGVAKSVWGGTKGFFKGLFGSGN